MRADVPIAFFSMHNDPRERAMQALLQHGGLVLKRMRRGRSTPILQYCPVCLAGDREAYLRRGWYFPLEVVCFNDGCLLMDACWQCGALLDPLSLAAPSPEFRCLACGARLADAPSLRLSEAIADQVMLYCALACAAVPPGTDCITDQGRDYIDALACGALRGTNPMNAVDRLHAVTLEAWHHRVAFARWKARRRRGTRRRKGRSYAAAALS